MVIDEKTSSVNTMRVAVAVASQIEKLIIDSAQKPGQRLPSERSLMQRLGVSRSALREGLEILRARGVIATQHGRGSFVANLMQAPSSRPMLHMLKTQPRTLYDLLEVREFLESESSRLAAERGTLGDYSIITQRYEELVMAQDRPTDTATHARLDHAFHLAICEAAHNPVLVHTLSSLNELMLSSVFASLSNLYHRQSQKKKIDRHHARLYNAVTRKMPQAAYRAAQTHIRSIRSELLAIEQEEQRLILSTLRL
jgi:GntR family transcriptional activator of glc operon